MSQMSRNVALFGGETCATFATFEAHAAVHPLAISCLFD